MEITLAWANRSEIDKKLTVLAAHSPHSRCGLLSIWSNKVKVVNISVMDVTIYSLWM